MAEHHAILPGAVRQNGYVVRDLDRAIEAWLALGVGPWLTMRHLPQHDSLYRGTSGAPVLSIALANSGDLQIELIQQEDHTPSAYTEFTDAGHEGFHHLAWWAEDFAAARDAALAAGWTLVQSGDGNGAAHFAYFDAGGATSTLIEVMELNDATRWMGSLVRDAAEGWDGADPVRPLL